MNLTQSSLSRIDDPALSRTERAQLRCEMAQRAEEAGDFEAAREAMGELWRRVGECPSLDGLDEETRGLVLLRAGSLSGWIGSTRQIAGAQEIAKDLISESIGVFERLAETNRMAEARIDLALCYWREGSFDEARAHLRDLLKLNDLEGEQRALTLLNIAVVERSALRHHEALAILTEATPLFEASTNDALKGKFHNTLALVLRNLGEAERRQDYIDRALVEYA
ncbi:MAG TPA: tetratricopeptide repeat protein, partial [Pyrinomonadaceae bacterium]|nr:tetratricopeptide repeat protein [Pyrinomonadaceae bacterium]